MSYRLHGLFSVILFYIAMGLGLYVIFPASPKMGLVFVGLILAATGGIVYSFCSKCPCQARNCSHILLGWIANLLPRRKPSAYTWRDISGLLLSFLVVLVFPQAWLWPHRVMFILFWVLCVLTVLDILLAVCPECKNALCPLNRNHISNG
jgi:hypothetical protein